MLAICRRFHANVEQDDDDDDRQTIKHFVDELHKHDTQKHQ